MSQKFSCLIFVTLFVSILVPIDLVIIYFAGMFHLYVVNTL